MCFLLDKKFSEQYEQHFAEVWGFNWYQSHRDDKGIDIYKDDVIIDVKCYARPKWVAHFEGCFIETLLPKSGRPGWFVDDKKKTTHYILLQDCCRESVSYYRGWYISKDALHEAFNEAGERGDLSRKEISSSSGYILPYKYLDEYSEKSWNGDSFIQLIA